MAKTRGRKPKLDRPRKWTVHVPASVHEAVFTELADPVTGRPPHGSLSDLTTRLLRSWLRGRQDADWRILCEHAAFAWRNGRHDEIPFILDEMAAAVEATPVPMRYAKPIVDLSEFL